MALTKTQVSMLYVAIFNRASEGAGNTYWQGTGISMADMATEMLATSDAGTYFGTSLDTNQAFIEHIYLNTLGKTVADDAAGIAYWVGLLDAGTSRGAVVDGLVNAATDTANAGDAQDQFNNRVTVSDHMADTIEDTPADYATSTSFSGDLTVTNDTATVTSAEATIDGMVQGKAFTLTTGVDAGADFLGNAEANTYTAGLLTLNDNDSLDGGAGNDTLNVETSSNITEKVSIANIENINLSTLGAISVDMKNISGVKELSSIDSTGKITVTAADSATMELGLKGSNTNSIDVSYATDVLKGTSDKLTVNLNGASGSVVVVDDGFESVDINTTAKSDITTITAPNAKTVTLSGTGELTIANGAIDSFETYNITNTAAVTLGSVASVKSLNATANTGGIVASTANTITTEGLTKGLSSAALVMDLNGSAILLGEGADNINVSATNLFTTSSGTVKLGAGDDKINFSAAGSGKVFIFGEDGDDTIHLGANLGSSDLIDGGAGNDTLSMGAGTYEAVVKGIENLKINGAATASFTSTDTAMSITDSGVAAVTVSNLLNGSTYSATVAKTGKLALGFKSAEAAAINIDLQKGISADIATANAKDITLTLGAASDLTTGSNTGIAVDEIAKTLTVNATGAVNTGVISGSSTEVLSTLKVTGDKAVTVGNVTNDKEISTVDVSSSGGNVSVGTVGDSTNTATDKNVDKISVVSDTGTADIGAIDVSGVASTATGSLKELTVTGKGNASTSTIASDTLGTVTITSSTGTADLGAITIGADTADTTDGTVTALKVSSSTAASTAAIAADKVDAITVTSTTGTATLGAITDGSAGALATIGTVDVSGKGTATVGIIIANALGNTNITSTGADVALAAITVANAANDSVTGDLTVKASTNIVAAAIAADKSGDMSFTATTGSIGLAGIDVADSDGTTITLDGKTTIDSSAVIQNTAGDLNVIAKGDANLGATAFTVEAASTANTDIDLSVDASALKGTFGISGTHATVTNNGTDADSSTVVKIGAGDSFVDVTANGGAVTVYGNTGADAIVITGTYATSTIYGEKGADVITGAAGVDTINGGEGADAITGGTGADLLTGGADVDTFIYAALDSTSSSMDIISDYTTGTDIISIGAQIVLVANTDAAGEATINAAGAVTGYNGASSAYDTFAEKLSQIDLAIGGVTLQSAVFTDNSKTYLYISNGSDTSNDGTDTVIELTGVTAATGITLTGEDISAIA